MKRAGISLICALAALTAVAYYIKPDENSGGRRELIIAANVSPARVEQIGTFNAIQSEILLEHDFGNFNWRKIALQCSSGVGPDFFEVTEGSYIPQFAAAGICLDLTPIADVYGLKVDERSWPGVKEEVSFLGRQYGYPLSVQIDILIYNKNVFDRFGVPYPRAPWTWEDFIAVAKRVTHRTGDPSDSVYGVNYIWWRHFFHGLEGDYFSEDGTRAFMQSEAMYRSLELYRDFLHRHRIALSFNEIALLSGQGGAMASSGNAGLFADGRFAMMIRPKYILVALSQALADQKRRLERWTSDPDRDLKDRPEVIRVGATLLPHFAGRRPSYYLRSRAVVVNAASRHCQDALAFLKFMSTPEFSRIVNRNHEFISHIRAYSDLGVPDGPPELEVRELHAANVEALKFGHWARESPFISIRTVRTLVTKQVSRMVADPEIEISDLLADLQEEVDESMQRNIARRPHLARLFASLTGAAQ